MHKNRKKGQSTLIIVFIIGIASLFLTLGFTELSSRQAKISKDTSDAKKAFYAAQAGIEDAILRLKSINGYGDPETTFTSSSFDLDGAAYSVTVSPGASDIERVVTSEGTFEDSVKTIEVVIQNTEEGTGFLNAVQSDNGGIILESKTMICKGSYDPVGEVFSCTGDTTVYSNADILGENIAVGDMNCSNANSSRILGNVFAVGNITQYGSGEGICATGNATANKLQYCRVLGERNGVTVDIINCTTLSGPAPNIITTPPEILPLPEFNPEFWQNAASNPVWGGSTWPGDCNIGTDGPDDCSSGDPIYEIGPKKIEGNLTINSNTNPTITGPIWVTGDFTVASNNNIFISEEFVNADVGTVIMADGNIVSNSNIQYPPNNLAVLLVVSTKDYSTTLPDPWDCNTPAIQVDQNTRSVIFYSTLGCVKVKGNTKFYGALVGQKVHFVNGAEFYYNAALSDAKFGIDAGGGWLIVSWRDVD